MSECAVLGHVGQVWLLNTHLQTLQVLLAHAQASLDGTVAAAGRSSPAHCQSSAHNKPLGSACKTCEAQAQAVHIGSLASHRC